MKTIRSIRLSYLVLGGAMAFMVMATGATRRSRPDAGVPFHSDSVEPRVERPRPINTKESGPLVRLGEVPLRSGELDRALTR